MIEALTEPLTVLEKDKKKRKRKRKIRANLSKEPQTMPVQQQLRIYFELDWDRCSRIILHFQGMVTGQKQGG